MDMWIGKKTVVRMTLTDEQIAALKTVDKLFGDIHELLGDDVVLASSLTGECVFLDEFPRFRGVLDCLARSYMAMEMVEDKE